jgi:hypothetical protein
MAVLRYSVLRLGLFAVALVGLLLAGMNPWLSPLLAAFIAWGLSYVLLPRARDAAALEVAERVEARRARGGRTVLTGRAREDADLEDAADEALRESSRPADEDPRGSGPSAAEDRPGSGRAAAQDPVGSSPPLDEGADNR